MANTPLLELRNITKRFPGVLANDHINLTLEEGEIHALLGENGAGKSTLMNILYGLYEPTEGEMYVRGREIKPESPSDSIAAGIGMVHQHFMLIPVFTVTENVMLGYEETQGLGGFLNRRKAGQRIRAISDQFGLSVDPSAYIQDLSVGVQQRVEIIKLLYRNADILIFDEPTAVLTPQEADELVKIMRSLVAQGKSIIFITHKLREVLEVADRITVIRRGKLIGTTTPAEADQGKLAEMMVGRAVDLEIDKIAPNVGDKVLQVENLTVVNDLDQLAVDNVTFDVRAGEVLGLAGVLGNGQTELVEAVTGMRPPVNGRIVLLDKDITHASPRQVTELGTAHVPEDRQKDGLVLDYPISHNMVLNTYYNAPYTKNGTLQEDKIRSTAQRLIKEYDVRTPSADTPASSLSGGNQQKVIIARELSRPTQLLVAAQPTRGVDVGAIEFIHSQIIKQRDEGTAVLLSSTELDEIMQLSDRIAVMYRGRIIAVVDAATTTKEALGLLMAGVVKEKTAETAA
jgi:simple sugar transport system ATP-binding protein